VHSPVVDAAIESGAAIWGSGVPAIAFVP
jgi:hypothetical protein